jgi:hypothetical protein
VVGRSGGFRSGAQRTIVNIWERCSDFLEVALIPPIKWQSRIFLSDVHIENLRQPPKLSHFSHQDRFHEQHFRYYR